jgi:hypothetical protein
MLDVTRHLQAIPSSASPEEAAAIVAALEQFTRTTAAPAAPAVEQPAAEGWRASALLEGVSRDPWARTVEPWLAP